MRICTSPIFRLNPLCRSLALDTILRQVHLDCTALNQKHLFTLGRFNICISTHQPTLYNVYQHDLFMIYPKEFSTTVTQMAIKKVKVKNAASKKIDEDQMNLLINVDALKKALNKALEDLRNSYIKYVSLRTTLGAIEEVRVLYKDDNYALNELADIGRKPNLVIINVEAFPDAMANIIQALQKSHMNLNPRQDGTTLYVQLPKVTREHREGLAKSAKSHMIKCKDNLTTIRNKYVKQLLNMEKQPEDLVRSVQQDLDGLVSKYYQMAENMYNEKQKELLGE